MASYPLVPDRIRQESREYDILSTGPSSGREARRARNTTGNPRTNFVLYHDHISFTEKEQLLDFFESRRGRWNSFTWTQPAAPRGDGLTYTVRFDQDTLEVDKPLGYTESPRFSVEVKLKEVL